MTECVKKASGAALITNGKKITACLANPYIFPSFPSVRPCISARL